MKIAILADPNRKSKDQPILAEAEKAFGAGSVVYAPITQIRFDIGRASRLSRDPMGGISVRFNGANLAEFDCIIAIPTITHSELFYTALRMLDAQTIPAHTIPINAEKYLLTMNEQLLFNFLGSNGLPVRKSITVASNASLDSVEENIKYPVIVKPPKKRVIVTNKQTLKDVISLYKIGTPIRIETPIKAEKNIWVFVLGDEVIASYEKTGNAGKADRPFAVDDKLKNIAIKARELIGCEYCSMRFLMQKNEWVLDKIALSPNFSNFQKITGVNIARHIVSCSSRKFKVEKPWWHTKIEEFFRIKK